MFLAWPLNDAEPWPPVREPVLPHVSTSFRKALQHRPDRPDRPTPRLPWSYRRTIRSDHSPCWHANRPRPPEGIPQQSQPRAPARVAVPSTR